MDLRFPEKFLECRRPPRKAWLHFGALAAAAWLSCRPPSAPLAPDGDRDGVEDGLDRCPNAKETINGIEDDDGCPDAGDPRVVLEEGRLIVLDTIRFDHGSASLPPRSLELLDQVALTLKANPEVGRMRVEGHTDDTGTRELNMRLSHERAVAVRRYLIERGVPPERLVAAAFGPDRPAKAGTDAAARARNRRVEFVLD